MQYSQDAVDLIKEFEGFSSTPYKCPAGHNTIGYGHTILSSNKIYNVTEEEATNLLCYDLLVLSSYINQKVKVTLKQCEHDALCSLIYNWGCLRFGRSKGLQLLNQRKPLSATKEFFSKEKGVVEIKGKFSNGLFRRRQAELSLWNSK